MNFSVLQNKRECSSRQLRVNGEVPFQEAYALEFKHNYWL